MISFQYHLHESFGRGPIGNVRRQTVASPFRNVRFHADESSEEEQPALRSRALGGQGGPVRTGAIGTTFDNDEAAARFYLTRVLGQDSRPAVRGMAALDEPQSVPDMRLIQTQESPLTKTRLVTFEQTQTSV